MTSPSAVPVPPPNGMPPPTPFDTGNQLLAEGPAQFNAVVIDTPAGQRCAVTIRTASATLTVFLQGADAKNWAANFARAAEVMSASGLFAANGSIPQPLPPGLQPPR